MASRGKRGGVVMLRASIAVLLFCGTPAFAQMFPLRGAPDVSFVFVPPSPTIADSAPSATTVATYTATFPNGAPYTGPVAFVAPEFDAGGLFALRGNAVVVNAPLVGKGPTLTVRIGVP
jgi:hypothetical protein